MWALELRMAEVVVLFRSDNGIDNGIRYASVRVRF
jgi:hypothetical protein